MLIPLAPRLIHDVPPEIAADFVRHTWTSYSRTLRQVVLGHRAAPDLSQAGVPILLLHGDHDPDAPLEHVSAMAAELSDAGVPLELVVLKGGHHLAIRQPEEVARSLDLLLATTPPGPADQ